MHFNKRKNFKIALKISLPILLLWSELNIYVHLNSIIGIE